jgi:hypothetical protein
MVHKVIFPKIKKNLQNFQNQRYIGNFMSNFDQMPTKTTNVPLGIEWRECCYGLGWAGKGTEFLIVDSFSLSADFSGSTVHKVGGSYFMYRIAQALYVPLTRKMQEIRKLGMNLLGTEGKGT